MVTDQLETRLLHACRLGAQIGKRVVGDNDARHTGHWVRLLLAQAFFLAALGGSMKAYYYDSMSASTVLDR